ncbi:MAG: glycosyltransferase family 8 protein [Oscillospiraceae bacterium]|nr:glycosyltransferase family 8 protein [Oscillospiraceae bacterium]
MEGSKPIVICYASDENYAPHMTVSIYSLMCNADKSRQYEIIILHSELSEQSREKLLRLGEKFLNFTVRFEDMSAVHDSVKDRVGSYITAATNYRLFILGELFGKYDRVLYIDCDTIVEGDISQLYDMDLEGRAVAAAEMVEARHYIHTKRALFYEETPYNFTDYCTKVLGIKHIERYFNAGVILFDLKRCRKLLSDETAVKLLNMKKWIYNDQDVLNILFNDSVKMLDLKWNYTHNIEQFCSSPKPTTRGLFRDARRTEYGIIHFISGNKPWNTNVALGEHYHKYREQLAVMSLTAALSAGAAVVFKRKARK